MKIAVTGASGFIGTELLAVLNKREDIGIIALTRDASLCSGDDQIEWRSTDYSENSLATALEGADSVIHLAGVRGTESDPAKFAANEAMTKALLAAMTKAGAGRIVFASTVSVYDDDSLMPWTEDAPLGGRNAYGDSKAACEKLIRDAAEECGITYGIARIAQVLGEGERRRGMMNVFIDTSREHGTLKVMGKSVAKKQYIYVKDLVEVLTMLAVDIKDNTIVNVGMKEVHSNLEIAKIVNEVFGNPSPIDYDDSYPETGRPFHMNTEKLRTELGFTPLEMKEALADMQE